MFIVQKRKYPQWWLRLRLSIRACIGTWKHLAGVRIVAGDTVNIHHRFEIVSRKLSNYGSSK